MASVSKPFNSINRRFATGDVITEAEDISPYSFADFVARGFIATAAPKSPPPLSFLPTPEA